MFEKTIKSLKDKNIHIVGVGGIEGSAIAVFLFDQGIKRVTLHDFSEKKEFEENFKSARDYLSEEEKEKEYKKLINSGYKINFKDSYLSGTEEADLIFVSQGWFRYEANDKLKKLEGKIPFSSITKLYFELSPCTIIGITGTLGKSTTTRLIYEMLKKCDKEVLISGNDRENPPVLDKLGQLDKNSFLVLEISNRQLIGLEYSPHISVVTSLYPNHLDDHGTFENYVACKRNIVAHQKENDFSVLNFDNKYTKAFSKETMGDTIFYSIEKRLQEGFFLEKDKIVARFEGQKIEFLNTKKLKIKGKHNVANSMAATAVGHALGLERNCLREALSGFPGLKHRLEVVREINGVSYIEDSQSTNPNAAISAIDALSDKKIVLVAGGFRPKFEIEDFRGMVEKFFSPQIKAVFLIGKIAPALKNEFFSQKNSSTRLGAGKKSGSTEVNIKICKDLDEAVKNAAQVAAKGEVVLFSPGVESFGEFKDYRERAERFVKLVNRL